MTSHTCASSEVVVDFEATAPAIFIAKYQRDARSSTTVSTRCFTTTTTCIYDFIQLHYIRVPRRISNDHVILMDATVATGAAAIMAIRVLLDHDVKVNTTTTTILLLFHGNIFMVVSFFLEVKSFTSYFCCEFKFYL